MMEWWLREERFQVFCRGKTRVIGIDKWERMVKNFFAGRLYDEAENAV